MSGIVVYYNLRVAKQLSDMREWLRGGVQPCQGWGRGFESRLALFLLERSLVVQDFSFYMHYHCTTYFIYP